MAPGGRRRMAGLTGALLVVAGTLLIACAALAALVLPGSGGGSELTTDGWLWIIGTGAAGWLVAVAGVGLRRRYAGPGRERAPDQPPGGE